jgi:DNA-nicking Smr family endonuclease
MAWKKDLAKLKQDLGKEEAAPGKISPPPKPKAVHPVSSSIEEEDNIFLSAMGLRPKAGERAAAVSLRDEPPALVQPKPAPQASKAEFSSAMGDLKGLKPLAPAIAQDAPAPVPVPVPAVPAPVPEAVAPAPAPPAPVVEAAEPAPSVPRQVQINLAAGMAIVVDGSLDLKGHARSDAEERLKERILDGYALGWRTLHVLVGSSPELRQMVLDLLVSPAGSCVARYAQAPVPMGGAQAWILYFRGPGAPEN